MSDSRVLIIGLGIAGMSAGVSLHNAGWQVTIIERAPERRTGGYFIGLFDKGREAAMDLGVFEKIHLRTSTGKSWEVEGDGSRSSVPSFTDQPGTPEAVLRGDIEAGLWESIEGNADIRFGTTATTIVDLGHEVLVTFKGAASGAEVSEYFDLVIGADGLRSSLRSTVFGPHEKYLKSMDAIICAFQMTEQAALYRHQDGITVAERGRALWIFPFSDRAPTALFTYRTKDIDAQFKRPAVEVLREQFAKFSGDGVVEHALDELATAKDFLFDSVHQVRMDKWSKGRVVLLGDAAWCLTLYSGMGAASAMMGAARLGKFLTLFPDAIEAALIGWEESLRPTIAGYQRAAYLKREFFVPSTPVRTFIRRAILAFAGKMARKSRTNNALVVQRGRAMKRAVAAQPATDGRT